MDNIVNLHYSTATKRLKDLMLSENFNDFKIVSVYNNQLYYIEFPSGEMTVICTLINAVISIDYYNSKRTEKFSFRPIYHNANNIKHEIAFKFAYAIWHSIHCFGISNSDEMSINGFTYHDSIKNWARYFARGYAKYFRTNEDIMEA